MILGAASCLATASTPSLAATYTDVRNNITYTYSVNSDGANTVTLGAGGNNNPCIATSSALDAADIPWTFADGGVNYTVTRLADHAFQGCAKITGNLVIPATVRRLGGFDFQNCTGLAGSIEIVGSPVVEFGDRGSFWNCNNATSAIIGPGVTNVINDLFRDGKKLEGVWVKGRCDVASGTQDYSIISQNSPVRNATALKVFLLGKNTRFSNKILNLTVLDSTTGCTMFYPVTATSGIDTLVVGGTDSIYAPYGAGQDLDIEIDEQAKLLTATVASASALTNVLNAASTFKSAFGLDTRINVTNMIELASDLITVEKLANATFNSLTFKVNTQAQLDAILSVVPASVPLAIDCSDAKVELTPPIGRKIYALISDEGRNGKYRPKINGLTITFY